MPTAVLRTAAVSRSGNVRVIEMTSTITHNNARLYNAGGRTYEYVGNDASGNRIYTDTSKN